MQYRTCFEAESASDSWADYDWPLCKSHQPKTRPCAGELWIKNYPHQNAPSPRGTTSEDSDEDDDSSSDAEDDPRPGLSEAVHNALRYNATNANDTTNQDSNTDADTSNDAEAIEDEELGTDYDTSSTDSIITSLPNCRSFLSAAARVPSPSKSQHKQCTNHYFLHPAILSTNSHIHAGATAVL